MKTVPSHIAKQLKSFNKDLRIRWSYERQSWILEHKSVSRDALFKPVKMEILPGGAVKEHILPELSDRYIQYHDCYYPIAYLKKLDNRVFQYLHSIDTGRFKNNREFMRYVEETEKQEEIKSELKRKNDLADVSDGVFDYMKVRGSQAFPGGTSI